MPEKRILIAESGASKTAWRMCEGEQVLRALESPGLNPSSLTKSELEAYLKQTLVPLQKSGISSLFFYGAGLKFERNIRLLGEAIQQYLPETNIEIENDLTAAIRSTGKSEGIVCILGTGSNACLYEKGTWVKNVGGHGYLLGDEGSGMDLGKQFLKGCLEGEFSTEISDYLEEKEGMNLGEIRTSVYESDQPNKRLASFAPYLSPWKNDPRIAAMLHRRFLRFLKSTVMKITDHQEISLDFVGGISANFTEEIQKACKELGLKGDSFIQSPIERLISYHANP